MHAVLHRPWRAVSSLLCYCLPLSALAMPPTFEQALNAAWQNLPEQAFLAQENRITRDSSPVWLAAPPSASLDYQQEDNASGSPAEWQAAVELPIARPALIGSQRAYRNAANAENDARANLLHWQLASELQTWWWDFAANEVSLTRNQQRLDAVQQQLSWLSLLIEQGERPASDRLAVQEQLQTIKNQLLFNNQQKSRLTQHWQQLTGLDELPDNWQFSQSPERALESHPLLQTLQARTQQADANFRSSESSRFNPRLSLGVKHTDELDAQPAADMMQLGISMDFGHTSYSARRDAVRQLSSEHANSIRTRQQLQREREALRTALPQMKQRWQELSALSEQAQSQYDGQYQAYQRGTLSGFQWLQIQNSIWQLQQQADDARIQYFRTISQWNQLQGQTL
ncbi:MAG: hypothetical protein CMI13_01165 [Oleibacter sp.]|nr:hypothetical protein [Thalassolituus sp.]